MKVTLLTSQSLDCSETDRLFPWHSKCWDWRLEHKRSSPVDVISSTRAPRWRCYLDWWRDVSTLNAKLDFSYLVKSNTLSFDKHQYWKPFGCTDCASFTRFDAAEADFLFVLGGMACRYSRAVRVKSAHRSTQFTKEHFKTEKIPWRNDLSFARHSRSALSRTSDFTEKETAQIHRISLSASLNSSVELYSSYMAKVRGLYENRLTCVDGVRTNDCYQWSHNLIIMEHLKWFWTPAVNTITIKNPFESKHRMQSIGGPVGFPKSFGFIKTVSHN